LVSIVAIAQVSIPEAVPYKLGAQVFNKKVNRYFGYPDGKGNGATIVVVPQL